MNPLGRLFSILNIQRDVIWEQTFKDGSYDLIMPSNYAESIRDAFFLLSPNHAGRILDYGCGSGKLLDYAKNIWIY